MADQADYADNAENESSEAGRSARGTTSRRRAAAPETTTGVTLDTAPVEPTLDLFGDGLAPEFAGSTPGVSPKVGRAMASPAARRAARQKTAPLPQEPLADPAEPFFHADPVQEHVAVEQEPAAPAGAEASDAAEVVKAAEAVEAPEPSQSAEPSSASAFSYAPTSASGNPAHLSSVVHASDFESALHAPVHAQADKAASSDLADALAVQSRRTKWMLTAAVAALVVTTGVAVVETTMLANFSSDAQAQQQRIEVLLQNQQAALDRLTARLDAPSVTPAAVVAPAVAAPVAPAAARAQSASAPSRHAARAAKAKAAADKAEKEKAASHAAARAHTQSSTRQTTKN
ncbi:hypothetical protein [Paraburkholderia bannensis]|uniref:hypothetical protein n=1 Tax=Paraburkholderia bannensis TaxID=765414 RepID=UPI002AAF3DE0|nr:hypothetical protein [Paraburkholderia bannensis]